MIENGLLCVMLIYLILINRKLDNKCSDDIAKEKKKPSKYHSAHEASIDIYND